MARAKMMQRLLENRLNKYHSIPTLEASAAFGAHAAELLGDFFLAQLAILAPEAVAAMQSVVAKAREVFEDMQRVQCALDQAMAALDYRKAIERPLLASRAESGAKYACMSLVQLVVELLQKDASACKYSDEQSDVWKSGRLHSQVPETIDDVTAAKAFRSSWLTVKATPAEARDFRVGTYKWIDAFTVSSQAPIPCALRIHIYMLHHVCTSLSHICCLVSAAGGKLHRHKARVSQVRGRLVRDSQLAQEEEMLL